MPALLTTREVAQILRVSWRTVRRLIVNGQLPACRVGVAWRVRAADVARLYGVTPSV